VIPFGGYTGKKALWVGQQEEFLIDAAFRASKLFSRVLMRKSSLFVFKKIKLGFFLRTRTQS
jgi:hypothetical protein